MRTTTEDVPEFAMVEVMSPGEESDPPLPSSKEKSDGGGVGANPVDRPFSSPDPVACSLAMMMSMTGA